MAGQDWGLVLVMGGAAVAWLLMLAMVVYLANASTFERARERPAAPPPAEPPSIEADEPAPAIDEDERPMAVVITASAPLRGREPVPPDR